jgi:hypothetical protein
MKEIFTVDVKVHPTVREFIINTNNGSDILQPRKESQLWQIVKLNLQLRPHRWRPVPDNERYKYVRVQLLSCKGFINSTNDDKVYLNPIYRNYLDESGQAVVAKYLKTHLKECVHNFVHGALLANPDKRIIDVIELFCVEYDLQMNALNEEYLLRSWQRSKQRRLFKALKSFCPLLF